MIITVYERYPRLKTNCYSLTCSCDCGNSCEFEENESLLDVYPDAKPIDKNQAFRILNNHKCISAMKYLEIK